MCVSVCVCSDLWIVVGVWVHVCAGACMNVFAPACECVCGLVGLGSDWCLDGPAYSLHALMRL